MDRAPNGRSATKEGRRRDREQCSTNDRAAAVRAQLQLLDGALIRTTKIIHHTETKAFIQKLLLNIPPFAPPASVDATGLIRTPRSIRNHEKVPPDTGTRRITQRPSTHPATPPKLGPEDS